MKAKINLQTLRAIDSRSFLIGLGATATFYALLFGYFIVSSGSVLTALEQSLASQVIPIEKTHKQSAAPSHSNHTVNKEYIKNGHSVSNTKDDSSKFEGLYETDARGLTLPIMRNADKMTSFKAFKNDFTYPAPYKPIVAFVIKDFGLSKNASETALQILPSEVSYSLSPYADMAGEWVRLIHEAKSEAWLNMPFETAHDNPTDQGEYTLFLRSSFSRNQTALHNILSLAKGYPGISGQTDKLFLNDTGSFSKAIDETYRRGLGYLELNPDAPALIGNMALAQNAPYIKADIEINLATTTDPFAALEEILKKQGYAVAVVPNYPENIKRLAAWIIKVAQTDYVVAPVSAMYERPLHIDKKPPTQQPATASSFAPAGLSADDLASPPSHPAGH